MTEKGYIQGAGDDSESWSHGLTAAEFWDNKRQLLAARDENIPDLIEQFKAAGKEFNLPHTIAVRVASTNICIGTLSAASQTESYDGVIICSDTPPAETKTGRDNFKRTNTLHFCCSDGKLGSRALRRHLPRLVPFINSLVMRDESPRLLVACSTGKDFSVGIALAVLCIFFDDECKSGHRIANPWSHLR